MLTSEDRALVTELQDRLIELYVQWDEAARNRLLKRGLGPCR
jgi:hypothetical protein